MSSETTTATTVPECPQPIAAFISPFRNRSALAAIASDLAALHVAGSSRLALEAFIVRVREHLEVAR